MRFILTYLSLIIVSCVIAQDTTFVNVYIAPGNDRSEAMIQSQNGDFILCGSTSSFDALDTDVHVIRLDDELNILWSKHYGQPLVSERGTDLLEDTEGNIYITGYTNATGYDMLLLKINPDGNLIWSQSYGSDDWDFVYAMNFDAEGNLVLVGNSYGDESMSSQAWLMKFSINGEFIWEKLFGSTADDYFRDVDFDAEGNIYLTGSFENPEDGTENSWTIKCSSEGDLIWEKFGAIWREEALDVCVLGEVCFVHAVRYSDDFGGSKLDYRYDLSGELLGTNYFLSEGNTYLNECEYFDDIVIVSGYGSESGNGGYDFYYNSQEPNGLYGQARTVGGESDDICTDVVQASNGLIYLSGYTESFDALQEDIVIVHSNVNVPADDATIELIEVDDDFITQVPLFKSLEISLYPNPCSDYLVISGLEYTDELALEIYSSDGRLLAMLNPDDELRFDISNLPNTTYLFRLVQAGKFIEKGQLIKN